jgi:hypothetical protein
VAGGRQLTSGLKAESPVCSGDERRCHLLDDALRFKAAQGDFALEAAGLSPSREVG